METIQWIMQHIMPILGVVTAAVALAEAIVRLTPTEKDNSVVQKIKDVLDFIVPNLATGGDRHISTSARKSDVKKNDDADA